MPYYLIEYPTSGAGLRSQGDAYKAAQAERKAYRERLGSRILLAGPKFDDPKVEAISSIMVLSVASVAEARALAEEDPYFQVGEFGDFTVHELRIITFNPPGSDAG